MNPLLNLQGPRPWSSTYYDHTTYRVLGGGGGRSATTPDEVCIPGEPMAGRGADSLVYSPTLLSYRKSGWDADSLVYVPALLTHRESGWDADALVSVPVLLTHRKSGRGAEA